MTPDHQIEAFVKEFVNDLEQDAVAVFAGAGMSKASGYVDWPELLRDIASELGLKIEREHDLISLAQFHVNLRNTGDGLARKILQEFSDQAEPSPAHKILARLPIHTYWTTNYDTLIEESLRNAFRVPDVKHRNDDLTITRPKRDAVVYKMHGDISAPKDAVIYKEQYETYYATHAPFIAALGGDLVAKTFLFIGFSFTDPNLDYVLSRLHVFNTKKRTHYCIMREAQREASDDDDTFAYNQRKQKLRIDDLKRFGIQTLLVDNYTDIPKLLERIEMRFRKKTVFVSGSAEDYGAWPRQDALNFIHAFSSECVKANLRVVNGFGWGVGSSVINGALEAIYANPLRYSEDQLIVRPFPQHGDDLAKLWEEYRQRMVSLAGIAIFVFGNKKDAAGAIVDAGGVKREFQIAIERGLVPIPIAATGFMAKQLWDEVMADPKKFYPDMDWIVPLVKGLESRDPGDADLVKRIVTIIKSLTK